ncbi:MAG: glucose-6-phosphate isomerase [Gammaproteobacteria bacterium]|nr:glucose-6-phosphate isomerase [Gammaproteobacteria bacterium]
MTKLSKRDQVWRKLDEHAHRISDLDLNQLLADKKRFTDSHLQLEHLLVDWSRQIVDQPIVDLLNQLAVESRVYQFLLRMSRGDQVNDTEARAATHVQQRSLHTSDQSLQSMLNLAGGIRRGSLCGHSGKLFTDVVNVGIGGSHLGPEMVYRALVQRRGPRIHFLSNAHPSARSEILSALNPDSTLFIVASKSYGTFETLDNARFIRQWMNERVPPDADLANHFIHVTSNPDEITNNETVLRVPSSIGGRFSLWSAMGLVIAIAFGVDVYQDLHAGARSMDHHVFETTDVAHNLALKLAMLAVWNTNVLNTESHLILPYDPRLQLLPAYLQQLEMESNGKSISRDGEPVNWHTSPIVWGGIETDGQHAYHQLLHQGTRKYSADIIVTRSNGSQKDNTNIDDWILANAVAQSTVMFAGNQESSDPGFKNIEGRHGSTIFVLNELNAFSLGALIALYEHKVASLGHLWNINSFDQWGVEAGKRLADDVYGFLHHGEAQNIPATTADLLYKIKKI